MERNATPGGDVTTTCTDEPYRPIADFALISDCHSAALISRDGSVDWCCFARFDAAAVFSRLLDASRGGRFQVCPDEPCRATRRYLPGTNVLETRFETDGGVVVLTDCLAVHEMSDPSDTDVLRPYQQLIRHA